MKFQQQIVSRMYIHMNVKDYKAQNLIKQHLFQNHKWLWIMKMFPEHL